MTIPWPDGQPDSSVGQDSGTQMSQGIQVMVGQLRSLERVISTQTAMMERTINAASRYQMAGQPQLRQDVLQRVAGAGGSLHGTRQTQVSPMGALSSLEGLKAFGAQQFGQWIAGMPLYEQPGAQGGDPGQTPAGTPNSQTGQGLPAQSPEAQPGAGAGGQQPPTGPPGGGPPRPPGPPSGGGPPAGQPATPQGPQGLPAMLFGSGTRQNYTGGQQAALATLQQVGARVAMSGSGLGGVKSALRDLPGVGLVMDAVQGGASFYQKQREAGRVYQEFEGGSNLGAQTERLHQAAYQLSMFGRMPEGAAAQAFGAVSAMGYNQAAVGEGQQTQNRQSALDFVYHNYTSSGMDVNQSLQVLQSASQSAVVNLQNVSTVLKAVSDSAGQAGTNADQARQQFNSYFNAALGQGAGNGAAGVAGGISSMQASMGKEFSGVNFSGELSQSRQYLLSGMSGLSPAQLQYTQRNDPGQYNKLLAGQNMQLLTQGGLMTPQMQSSLNSMISAAGGGKALASNPDLRDQISQQFLNQWQVKGNINENQWASQISAMTGVTMNANQAFDWIVSQSAGVNEASHNATVAKTPGSTYAASNIKGAPTGKYGLSTGSTVATGHGGNIPLSWQKTLQNDNSAAAKPYLAAESKSGQRSPVLEALLQNTSQSDQVRVSTRNGARVMSMADAMKYYPNEMAAGSVEFYSKSGKAIGDTSAITHGLVNAGASVTGEEKQKTGASLGVSASKYDSAHKNSQVTPAAGGQSVKVDLSSEAKQLLKLLPSNSDTAAASSQVPANYYTSQASR